MPKRKQDGFISRRSDGRWNVGYGSIRTVRKTKEDAVRYLRELRMAGPPEKTVHASGTLKEFLFWWIDNVDAKKNRPATISQRRLTCERYILPVIGNKQAHLVKTSSIQNIVDEMVECDYAAGTIAGVVSTLSMCYKYYVGKGILSSNPCNDVIAPKIKSGIVNGFLCYTPEEMRLIRAELLKKNSYGNYAHNAWAILLFIANTGLRSAEARYLKWKHINLHDRIMGISGQIIRVYNYESGVYENIDQEKTKTESGERTVPLNDVAVWILETLRNRGVFLNEDDYVFLNRRFKPFVGSAITNSFTYIVSQAGIKQGERHGVHALRHTFATTLLNNGTPIKVVSQILGHSDISITLNTYIHHSDDEIRNAVSNISF